MLRFGVLVILVLLTGCASTHVYERSFPGSAALVEVHFIRHDYPPTLRGTHIYSNDILVADVANNTAVTVTLPTGENSIRIEADDGQPLAFDLELAEGETRYFVYTGNVTSTGTYAQGNVVTVGLRWNLRIYEVDSSQAEAVLNSVE